MNRQQQDELAELFAQGMQLTPQAVQVQSLQQTPATVESIERISEKHQEPPIHFVSSHYTHTGHIRGDVASEPFHNPPPSYHEAVMPEALAQVLLQNSIDPSALLPNQIHLFTNADYDQRLRLLELWRIAPPSYREERTQTMTATSLEREEAEAKARYEQRMHARNARHEEHGFDTFIPDSPMEDDKQIDEVEPYIVHGYGAASVLQSPPSHSSLDPVYAASPGLWQAPSYAHAVREEMEEQYGMVQQIRNHADWERINQQGTGRKLAGFHGGADVDDDMVM